MASDRSHTSLVVYSMPLGFAQLFNEIAVLSAEVDRKDWSWFLPRNALTEEEIYAHPSFEKIRAYCGQMDNLYFEWRKSSSITDDEYKAYHVNRLQVETELANLRIKIIDRKPTFLDIIVSVINNIISFVRKHIPLLEQAILDRLGISVNRTIDAAHKRIQSRFKDL
jgi:hypothetical protein